MILVKSLTLRDFFNRCLLSSIVHAIEGIQYPDFSHEQSWDKDTYCLQDTMGGRGAITFAFDEEGLPVRFAGAVFSIHSVRRPIENPRAYFDECNEGTRMLAYESLEYLLDGDDGETKPYITSGLWSQEASIMSPDTLEVFLENGGHLLEFPLVNQEEETSLTLAEINLVQEIYAQKSLNWHSCLRLSSEQLAILKARGESLDACKESFAELKIQFP